MQLYWLTLLLAHPGHDPAGDAPEGLISQAGDTLPYVILGVGAVAALLIITFIFLKLRSKKPQHAATMQPLEVSIASLSTAPPPETGARIEVYNIPMRLALLVLAPVGRDGKIPTSPHLPQVIDAIAPNLMEVMNQHQPEFRRWPPQLSSQGFSQIFFTNVPLPGDGGKNTPWCALAGRFDGPSGPMLAGMVCIAAKPNAVGQVAVSQPGQWLDILRVKT